MKELRNSIILFIAFGGLGSSTLTANPIAPEFFSELAFDSTGWKLEFYYTFDDTISLNGWYLVSGNDTAYFKDGKYLSRNYLVVSKDSLIGQLNIDRDSGSIAICSPLYEMDRLNYGPRTYNHFPPLKDNQSLCNFYYYGSYYLDYSQTIGAPNDAVDATGTIYGYVFDADGKPAVDQKVLLNGYYPTHPGRENRIAYSDSSGYFTFSDVFATNNSVFVERNPREWKDVNFFILPKETLYVEINLDWITDIKKDKVLEKNYLLNQNYPNPFNPTTTIEYSIPAFTSSPLSKGEAGRGSYSKTDERLVTLKIYDILGREVSELVNKQQNPGTYKVEFNASNLSSGTYFYKLQAGDFIEIKKMMVLK